MIKWCIFGAILIVVLISLFGLINKPSKNPDNLNAATWHVSSATTSALKNAVNDSTAEKTDRISTNNETDSNLDPERINNYAIKSFELITNYELSNRKELPFLDISQKNKSKLCILIPEIPDAIIREIVSNLINESSGAKSKQYEDAVVDSLLALGIEPSGWRVCCFEVADNPDEDRIQILESNSKSGFRIDPDSGHIILDNISKARSFLMNEFTKSRYGKLFQIHTE